MLRVKTEMKTSGEKKDIKTISEAPRRDDPRLPVIHGDGSGYSASNIHETEGGNKEAGETTLLPKVRAPRAYKVLLLNDDFTPMDFVILVLQKFFKKNRQEAEKVMLEVHHRGAGVAGVFSKEVAEMKVHQVDQFSKSHQYPLKCVMEAE
jgi:ATP-dependent Clp protease adaptor protein ClpS